MDYVLILLKKEIELLCNGKIKEIDILSNALFALHKNVTCAKCPINSFKKTKKWNSGSALKVMCRMGSLTCKDVDSTKPPTRQWPDNGHEYSYDFLIFHFF